MMMAQQWRNPVTVTALSEYSSATYLGYISAGSRVYLGLQRSEQQRCHRSERRDIRRDQQPVSA